jgi:membrane fusion protein (multidrug efflux system)
MKSNYLLLLGLLFTIGCNSNSSTGDNPSTETGEYPTVVLSPRPISLHREYVGDIQAVRNVEIYARVKGYLEQMFVDEGQEVKKGQLLFAINSEEYETELATARANLQSAIAEAKAMEYEVNRIRDLVSKNVVSQSELDVAKARYDALSAKTQAAQSAESSAAINLAYTKIKAPFDGVIDRIPYKMGSLINEGTLLTTVSDTKAVNVYFNVSEREYLEYVKSDRRGNDSGLVDLFLADGSEFSDRGKIETLEGEFDEGTGSIAFRARFMNPQKILKHGSSGTIRLTNTIDSSLLVPQKAVFEIQDKSYVYVVNDSNEVKTRSFLPKTRTGHFYVVESGLEAGEKIVYEGTQSLKEGQVIKTKLVNAE